MLALGEWYLRASCVWQLAHFPIVACRRDGARSCHRHSTPSCGSPPADARILCSPLTRATAKPASTSSTMYSRYELHRYTPTSLSHSLSSRASFANTHTPSLCDCPCVSLSLFLNQTSHTHTQDWLDIAENADKWCEGKLTASERRVLVTHWLGEAVARVEKAFPFRRMFEKYVMPCGCADFARSGV
jgi:hypothetical protein